MSLEAFTGWIKDLVSTNPTGTDGKSQGDDHIRGLKATLKAQFSGLTQGKAVTVSEDDLNSVVARVLRAGDTMTGPLVLWADAAGNLEAVTLQQLVAAVNAINGDVVTKVNRSGDTMTGPLTVGAELTVTGTDKLFSVGDDGRRLGFIRTSGAADGIPHYKIGSVFDGWVLLLQCDGNGAVASMELGLPGTHTFMKSYLDLVRDAVDPMEAVTYQQLQARTANTDWQYNIARVGTGIYVNPNATRKIYVRVQSVDSGDQILLIGGVSWGGVVGGITFVVPAGSWYKIGDQAFHNSVVSELVL